MEDSVVISSTTSQTELSIVLIPSPDDLPKSSNEYQAELSAFARSMREQGIDFSSRAYMMESAGGGGFSLGEFLAVAKTISPALAGLVGAWLHAKYGRKVKLKYKNLQVEATKVEEVERLVKLISDGRKKK